MKQFKIWLFNNLDKYHISNREFADILQIGETTVVSKLNTLKFTKVEKFYIRAYFASKFTGVWIPLNPPILHGVTVSYSKWLRIVLLRNRILMKDLATEIGRNSATVSAKFKNDSFTFCEKYYIQHYLYTNNIR